MKINWFPGHMTKTLKEIKRQLINVDMVVYVLDSRAPISSINPSLNKLSENKPVLYVFNKLDMADEKRVFEIAKQYKGDGKDSICLNSTSSKSVKEIKQKILSLCKAKIDKFMKKGIKTVIRAMVVGVPNSGKSTFINNLCHKSKLVTGNKPGVTKQVKWISIGDNIEICDTPGTLYPNLENQAIAKNLFFIGSIKDEIMADITYMADEFIKIVKSKYPQFWIERYAQCETLEDIAKKRGYLLSKNEYDLERTAFAVLDDFRKGRIGKITLD